MGAERKICASAFLLFLPILSSAHLGERFYCPAAFGDFPISELSCVRYFYRCSYGVAKLKKCPGKLNFHPSLMRCSIYPCWAPTTTWSTVTSSELATQSTAESPGPGMESTTVKERSTTTKANLTTTESTSTPQSTAIATISSALAVQSTTTREGTSAPTTKGSTTLQTSTDTTKTSATLVESTITTTGTTIAETKETKSTPGSTVTLSATSTIDSTAVTTKTSTTDKVPSTTSAARSTTTTVFTVTTVGPISTQSSLIPTTRTSSTTTISSTTTTNRATTAFVCPPIDGPYPNPNDCQSFYLCSNGILTSMKCPNNLIFNPVLNVCDWSYNVPNGCNNTKRFLLSSQTSVAAPNHFASQSIWWISPILISRKIFFTSLSL